MRCKLNHDLTKIKFPRENHSGWGRRSLPKRPIIWSAHPKKVSFADFLLDMYNFERVGNLWAWARREHAVWSDKMETGIENRWSCHPVSAAVISDEIVKSYVRESLSSLTPRHFWALSTISLMLTCVNSHLLTYVPLPLTTSRHRQCRISHGGYYCIPAWCTLHCDYVGHPHWTSTSILDIFTTSSLMLYACRSPSSQILFRNYHNEHYTLQISPGHILMTIFDRTESYSL